MLIIIAILSYNMLIVIATLLNIMLEWQLCPTLYMLIVIETLPYTIYADSYSNTALHYADQSWKWVSGLDGSLKPSGSNGLRVNRSLKASGSRVNH